MRFVYDNLYPLFAALILIVAVTCWFGTSVPAAPKPLPPVAESWVLPKLAEHDSSKSIAAITARNLWNIPVVVPEAPKEPEWHVLGIVRSGADRFILLAYADKPLEMLKVGDALPDGLKIVQIEEDRFFVMTADKKKLAFGIYKHEPAK